MAEAAAGPEHQIPMSDRGADLTVSRRRAARPAPEQARALPVGGAPAAQGLRERARAGAARRRA